MTEVDYNDGALLVDLEELMHILSVGRRRALSIAEMAKCRVYIGRCLRFNVNKLKNFLDKESI